MVKHVERIMVKNGGRIMVKDVERIMTKGEGWRVKVGMRNGGIALTIWGTISVKIIYNSMVAYIYISCK